MVDEDLACLEAKLLRGRPCRVAIVRAEIAQQRSLKCGLELDSAGQLV
jgi:hypothetical protein